MRRLRDRAFRAALSVSDRLAGGRYPHVRAVCRYGIDLIDSGASIEFQALVRQRLARALARAPRPRRSGAETLRIDARRERLDAHGLVVPKTTCRTFPADTNVLVSVVIPCFNYGAFLEDAVASARAQSLASVEIIVVNDGSTEADTVRALRRLAEEGDVLVLHQPNQGLPAARNLGIAAARGEYICCLDADDLIEPTYLEQAIAVLEGDRSFGFCGSWVQLFGDQTDVWRTRDFDAEDALTGNFTSGTSVFRHDDWEELGGYRTEMTGGFEDWEFWIRLASLGRRGASIAHPLFRHRRHGRTMTDSAKDIELELRRRMRLLCPPFYTDARLRRRLGRLASAVASGDRSLASLAHPGVIRRRAKPGLVVVVSGLFDGGAHTLLLDIVSGETERHHVVVLTTDPGPHPLDTAFRAAGAEVVHLDRFLPEAQWFGFLEHLIVTRSAAGVLSSDSRWYLEQVDRLRRAHPDLRLVDLTHNHVPTATLRAAMAHSTSLDRHLVVSSRIADALIDAGVDPARVAEVPNGVDERIFSPDRIARCDARRWLASAARPASEPPWPADDPLVLAWIGRLSEEKEPLQFLDLVRRLRSDGHQVCAVMYADGPLAGAVDARVREWTLSAHVRRRPFVPRTHLGQVYAAADLLVLTSRVEGMPLVVLEALASGCPVAATNVGDVARIVTPGVNGFLVPPGSSGMGALAEMLPSFIRDAALRTGMRHAAAQSLRRSTYRLSDMRAAYARLLS
jgi:glycosyltransferase involved in cell wall biosynthesis